MKTLNDTNADSSAFSCATDGSVFREGLSKREYFAGLAMQGMLANKDACDFDAFMTASISIEYADELLKQLQND